MRCVLEVKGGPDDDSKKEETVVSEEDSTASFRKAVSEMGRQDSIWVSKVVLWREFDSIEEAAAHNDKCVYYIGKKDGRVTLRNCIAAC